MLQFTVFVGLGVLILYLIYRSLTPEQREEAWTAMQEADYRWLLLSILFGTLSHVSRAMRWRMLIRPLGANPRLGVTFLTVMIGYVANMGIPRLGEVLKCTFLSRYERVPADKLVGTVVAERSVDAISLLVVFALTLIFEYQTLIGYVQESIFQPFSEKLGGATQALALGGLIFVLFVGLIYFLLKRFKNSTVAGKFKSILSNLKTGVMTVRDLDNVPAFIFHSVFIWTMYFMMVYICFPAMEATEGLGISAGIAILAMGSVGIIVSPGGAGAYQLIVAAILGIYGIEESLGLAFGNIVWGGQTLLVIVLGLASFGLLPLFKRREADPQSAS